MGERIHRQACEHGHACEWLVHRHRAEGEDMRASSPSDVKKRKKKNMKTDVLRRAGEAAS